MIKTVQIHIFMKWDHPAEEPRLTIFQHADMEEFGYVKLESRELTIEVFPDELREKQVSALKANKARIIAESATKIRELQEQINSFLALEYKPKE